MFWHYLELILTEPTLRSQQTFRGTLPPHLACRTTNLSSNTDGFSISLTNPNSRSRHGRIRWHVKRQRGPSAAWPARRNTLAPLSYQVSRGRARPVEGVVAGTVRIPAVISHRSAVALRRPPPQWWALHKNAAAPRQTERTDQTGAAHASGDVRRDKVNLLQRRQATASRRLPHGAGGLGSSSPQTGREGSVARCLRLSVSLGKSLVTFDLKLPMSRLISR